ncbi:hypothetical protein D3C76_1585990 [compost metagenome]
MKALHVGQGRMYIQVLLGRPDLVKHEQARVLPVAQHVVLDAAGFGAAQCYVAAKQRFESVGFFRAGFGLQNEAVLLAHGESPEVGERI